MSDSAMARFAARHRTRMDGGRTGGSLSPSGTVRLWAWRAKDKGPDLKFPHPQVLLTHYLSHGFLPFSLTFQEVFSKNCSSFSLSHVRSPGQFCGLGQGFSISRLAFLSPPYSCSCLQNPENSAQSQKHITLLDNPARLRDFPNLACSLQMV